MSGQTDAALAYVVALGAGRRGEISDVVSPTGDRFGMIEKPNFIVKFVRDSSVVAEEVFLGDGGA